MSTTGRPTKLELATRLRFETLLTSLSAGLIHVTARDTNVAIERALQQVVTFLWLASMLFVVVDTTLVLRRLDKDLKEKWPAKEDRKGAMFYAGMRAVQIRRLRLPPPKFRPGGRPVVPKVKK